MKIYAYGRKGPKNTNITLQPEGFRSVPDYPFKVGMEIDQHDPEYVDFVVKNRIARWSIRPFVLTLPVEDVNNNFYGESNGIFVINNYKPNLADPVIKITSKSEDPNIENLISKISSITHYDPGVNGIKVSLKGVNLGELAYVETSFILEVHLDDNRGHTEIHSVILNLSKKTLKTTLRPCFYSSPIAGYELGIIHDNPNNLKPVTDYNNTTLHYVLDSLIKDPNVPSHYPTETEVYIGLLPGSYQGTQDPVITCNNSNVIISDIHNINLNPTGNGYDTTDTPDATPPKGKIIEFLNELSTGTKGSIEPMNVKLTYWVVKSSSIEKDVILTITNPDNNETVDLHISFDLPPVVMTVAIPNDIIPNKYPVGDYLNEIDIRKVPWPYKQYHIGYDKLNVDTTLFTNSNPCIFPKPDKPNENNKGYYYWNMYPSTYAKGKIFIGSPGDYVSKYALVFTDMKYQSRLCMNDIDKDKVSFRHINHGTYFNKVGNVFKGDYRYVLEASSEHVAPARLIRNVDRLGYDRDEFDVIITPRLYEYEAIVCNDVRQTLHRLNSEFYIGDVLEIIFRGHMEIGEGDRLYKPGHPAITNAIVTYRGKVYDLKSRLCTREEPELQGCYSIVLPKLDKPGEVTISPVLSPYSSSTGRFYVNGMVFKLKVQDGKPDIRTDLDDYFFTF